jgi:hypothetical protein
LDLLPRGQQNDGIELLRAQICLRGQLPHLTYDAQQVPYVSTTVSGKNSRLKRVFIQLASKKDWYSLAPKVIAIELFGTDVATGAATYEKIIP